jgi:hypothetical protein
MDQKFIIDPQLLAFCAFIVPLVVAFITKHGVAASVKQYTATAIVAAAVVISAGVAVANGSFHIGSAADAWNLLQVALAQFAVARVATEGGVLATKALTGDRLGQMTAPNFGFGTLKPELLETA